MGFPGGLARLTQSQLVTWAVRAKRQIAEGQLPDYIPLLAKADAEALAVQVQRVDGQVYLMGNVRQSFVLMSVVKPFLLLYLLQERGPATVFAHVGMQPSDQPFYAIEQLVADQGRPRNPMLNSGAIALCDQLPGDDGASRCAVLCDWLNHYAETRLTLDQAMLQSVRSLNNETNRALANLLHQADHVRDVDVTLDTYNHICCLSGTVTDLARLGLLLAHPQSPIATPHRQTVNTLMFSCGLYEESSAVAVRIGLPIKSGVSGIVLAVVPGQGAIACYSPPLNANGNSIAGIALLEQMSQELGLSVLI